MVSLKLWRFVYSYTAFIPTGYAYDINSTSGESVAIHVHFSPHHSHILSTLLLHNVAAARDDSLVVSSVFDPIVFKDSVPPSPVVTGLTV